ncbi:hypothetical protein [Natronorubrum halophilum]|uniref:hypothetical protein n=1 Tax=Natronorubrum halophilum TaxID=1702106 RepID=UPI0010C17C73|nr:hypothetical protein [Natronorubrum halophilum]
MPENEQQDKTLSEILVKEAVGKGMDSPMRDSILEAVEEADGSTPGGKRSLPLAGVLFGAGAVLGFLAGRESPDLEETPLEDVQEPDIIEDVIEETTSDDAEMSETESESETTDDGGSSRLSRVLLAVGLLAGVAVLRRRLSGGEEEEWEPIEEFEPATGDEFDVDADDESEAEEAEAETDESDETEEE